MDKSNIKKVVKICIERIIIGMLKDKIRLCTEVLGKA